MNRDFMQINDTDYVISHGNGKIYLAKSNNNIERILMLENDIEFINKNIIRNDKFLKKVNFNEKARKLLNIFILIGGISITLAGISSSFGVIKTLVVTTYALLIMKTMGSAMYGIKILNKRKIKKLTSYIETNSQRVEKLTKELEELKTKSNYQKISYSKTQIKPMKQPTYEHSQNKVKPNIIKAW